jgi:hypothetical protein
MFRMGLLTSTAMTAVALLLSGAPRGAHAQTDMHVASRDPNTRFLCTYGQFLVSASSSNLNYYSGWFSVWERVGRFPAARQHKLYCERWDSRSRNSVVWMKAPPKRGHASRA